MERFIQVVVNVTSVKHAEQIKEDIHEIIKMRTTLYYIGDPTTPISSIKELGNKDK